MKWPIKDENQATWNMIQKILLPNEIIRSDLGIDADKQEEIRTKIAITI